MKTLTTLLLATWLGFAQSDPPMQMFVFVYPPEIATATSVSISGSVPLDGNGTGRIVVTPPSQKPITVNANWDGSGNYTVDFKTTQWAGDYKVEVFSPGGHGYGKGAFKAKSTKEMKAELQSSEDMTIKLVQTEIKDAEDMVVEIPPSPATKDAQAKLKILEERLLAFRENAKLEAALDPVLTPVPNTPDVGTAGVLKSLATWKAKTAQKLPEIERQQTQLRQKAPQCEKLESLNQALSLISTLIGIAGEPFKIITAQFPRDSASSSPLAWIGESNRLTLDTAGQIAQAGFQKYCDQFQGTFTASLHAEFRKNNKTWWTYDEGLAGTVILRYAKGQSAGQIVHVTGEFKGTANNFTCRELALPILFPELMADSLATVAYKKSTLPDPQPFTIPVEGEINGDKMTLRLGSATVDLKEDSATHVVNVVTSPMLLAPKVVAFDLPYKTAQYIFMRATRAKAMEIPVSIDPVKKIAFAIADFRNTMTPDDALGVYKVYVKACNPNCQ